MKKTVKLALKELMSDELACSFNWKGRPPKEAFATLSLTRVLHCEYKCIMQKKISDVL